MDEIMESRNIIFSSQRKLKEVKGIFSEFQSIVNKISELQNFSNNLTNQQVSVSNKTIDIRANSRPNDSGYLNDPSNDDFENSSTHNQAYNITDACKRYNSSSPDVLRIIDKEHSSKQRPAHNFGAISNENYDDYLDVPRDGNVEKMCELKAVKTIEASHLNPIKKISAASSCNGNGYSMLKVFDVETPIYDNGFSKERLEMVLEANDMFDYRMDSCTSDDMEVDLMNSCTSGDMDVDTEDVTSLSKSVDGGTALVLGSSNAPAMIDVAYVDFIAEPINTSSIVNASNLFADETSVTTLRECSESNKFDNGLIEVDCEDDFNECKTGEFKRYRGCDNSRMFVPTSDAGPKKYNCKYCNVRTQKLERHLRTVHKNEADVRKYLAFPLRSAERRKVILKIQKDGDFKWNNNKELNNGEYAVRRRPNKKFNKKAWDLLTCPGCLGSFSKSYLRRHWNKECSKNAVKDERGLQQLARAVEGRLHAEASQELVDLFARLRESENIRCIRFDWLVICYGNELCLTHSPHYQQSYICGKLRAAGNFLRQAKLISSEITDMSSIFHVRHCNTVVDAIRYMGKFDHKSKRFGSPGTALTMVTLINTIGDLLASEDMKMDDPVKERDVERFLKVFQRDVRTKISKLASITKIENRRHKNDNIPTTEDVNKLSKYLDSERKACFSHLAQEYSYEMWLKLSQLTMVSIMVYNRRRAGEMQNLLTEDFEKREIVANQCGMLSDSIREEAKRKIKSRVMVRNKLGKRAVPILLKHCWDDWLQLLVHNRRNVGIPESNEFLFALPTQTGRIRTNNVCTIMRSFSVACGAENPSSLRGTNLRKHIASSFSTKNLSDNDISNLTDFLGHAEAVHRAFYRINPLAYQVSKMSFLFDSAQGNGSSNEGSEDNSNYSEDEYKSDDEQAPLTPLKLKATHKSAKKNLKRNMDTKRRERHKITPKKTARASKKNITTTKTKKKRSEKHKETNKNMKTSMKTKK
ncbi:hypothetical protein Bhyg_12013 [Pseudolycoriella hygida]|uniref:Uncharacterized protein n=1 Tax=Pseudolycoriella hygida TaxID=35572 RepID=A0A9Q0RYW2_9DIPT|nr:hypothetical protein Bhyg_12013 [Pseudolycoriella hygida]